MFFLIGLVLIVLAVVVLGGGWYAALNPNGVGTDTKLGCVGTFIALGMGVVGLLLMNLVIIQSGFVGVVRNFGQVQPNTLEPGLHVVLPFVNTVESVDIRVVGHPFENLAAASKEYQDVIVTGTLNTHVSPEFASTLVSTVGTDYEQKIILPAFADILKEVVPTYSINDVLANRDAIRATTKTKLGDNLSRYGIIVGDVYIANIDFSEAYKQAVENKQVQEQRVQTEQNILEQKRIQAQQAVITAEGEANSAIERARGQAESNRLINSSLTTQLLQWTYVQKLSDKISVMLVPNGQQFILPLPNTGGAVQ